MRDLLLALIISLIFAANVMAVEVRGDIDDELKTKLSTYIELMPEDKFSELLHNLGFYVSEKNTDYIVISKQNLIRSINIKGEKRYLESTLLPYLGVSIGDPIYLDTLYNIKKHLEEFYKSNGFKDAVVSVKDDSGNILINVEEGDRYYIDEVEIVYNNTRRFFTFKPSVFSPKLIEKYFDAFNYELKQHGIWGAKIVKEEPVYKKRYMLFDLLNPDESILSVFKNNILMKDTVYLSEGTHYKLAIKNNSLPEQDLTYIKDFITDRLNLSDEMNIQTTAVELEEQLKKIGYVNVRADIEVEDGFINVYISYDDRVTLFKANISDGKDTIKLNSIDQVKELASIGNIEESKKIIITELKSRGFIDATIKNFNLKTSKGVMTLDVEVDLGNQTLINTVYINGKKVFTNLLLPFTEDNIAIVKQQVFEYVSDKTFIKDIELEKIRNGGIYFKVIGEEIKVADVLSNIPDLGNNIRKKFFYKDKKLTTKKWQEIYTYLMINKNAEYISLNMTEMDNKTILTIYKVEAKPNRFSGSISFDSVDKLTLELGYKRFNIFDTGRVLGLSGKISTNEKSISLSVSGQKTIGRIVDDSHSIFYKKRDEFDFRYKNPALESIFRIRYKLAEFFTGFRIEHINIYSTDFSDEYDQMYRKKYNVLSLPLKAIIRNKDFETYENYGVMLALSEQPAISSKDDFLLHKGYIEGYKTFFSNYLVRVKADIERVSSGNDVPLNYLLTLGGPDKMKAFSYRKLGKHDPNTGDTIGSKALVYSYYMLGYKPSRNITVGPFFEYGGIGDSFSSLNFYKDIGVELLVTAKELGSLSFSYAYNPFSPYSGKQAFYINFGIHF